MTSPTIARRGPRGADRRRAAFAAGALACALVSPSAGAAAAGAVAPPDGAAVLDRYVEVTGGKAAYDSLRNRVVKATLSLPGQNISLDVTEYRARPRQTYVVVESQVLGKIESGVSGDVAWESSTMAGPRLKEGPEEQETIRDATFDLMANWRKAYAKAEVAGADSVEGRPCWKVVLTPRFGRARTVYCDRETGLVRKSEFTVDTPAGTVNAVTLVGDFKKVDGILIPHRAETTVAGQKRILTIHGVQHNVSMPVDRFALPADVKKLAEARK